MVVFDPFLILFLRDLKGAKSVNLTSFSEPQDVYTYVLKLVNETIEIDSKQSEDSYLTYVSKNLLGKVNRKVLYKYSLFLNENSSSFIHSLICVNRLSNNL